MKWKCKSSKLVLNDKYFKVRKDIVELPNKNEKTWIYWDSTDSAMVLGMTEDHKLVMIKQYRYLVGRNVIEFPSGSLNKNEDIKVAARREFLEETGYQCKKLIHLCGVYETYGQLNRKIHIFFATNVKKIFSQKLDKGEVHQNTKVKLVDFNKAVSLAINNKIDAMGSSLAILILKEKIKSGKIKY
jgi:ADP-ribose pyrophosphatase